MARIEAGLEGSVDGRAACVLGLANWREAECAGQVSFDVARGSTMTESASARYWGLHLDERSRKPTSARLYWQPRFSIQLLARDGGPSEKISYFDEAAESVILDGVEVPRAAIAAIKALEEGIGVYLTADGTPTEPF
jgi:hypothetical protein